MTEGATMTEGPEGEAGTCDVAVLGGGLAGLVAAVTAARSGLRVTLIEPRPLGGRARCDHRDGFTFNRGPRALYLGGAARAVLDELGVDTSQGVPPATRGAVGRVGGRLHRIPQGPGSLLTTSMLRPAEKVSLGRFLAGFGRLDTAPWAGRSFGSFLDTTTLSPTGRELVRMIGRIATYAADPDEVDAQAVLEAIQQALGPGVRYLDGGFQSLVDGLTELVERHRVRRLPRRARSLGRTDPEGPVVVQLDDESVIEARSVVVATGLAAQATELLGAAIDGTAGLTAPVTAACLELGVSREPRHPVLFGVGEPLYLSTHRARGLAPEGSVVVHVMRNHRHDETLAATEQRAWLHEAARQAGIAPGAIAAERFLASMVVSGGHPTGPGGGLGGRPAVAGPDRPGVFLAGDWVGPTGLLSDAAVASGRESGRAAAAHATARREVSRDGAGAPAVARSTTMRAP